LHTTDVLTYGRTAGLGFEPPRADWRITCIFVDKRHRGQGVARAALETALAEIAAAGGGLVEAISEVTIGRDGPGSLPFQRDCRAVRAVRVRAMAPGRQTPVDRQSTRRRLVAATQAQPAKIDEAVGSPSRMRRRVVPAIEAAC